MLLVLWQAPTADEIREVIRGRSVKICDGGERFWTEACDVVREPPEDPFRWRISAEVDNGLVSGQEYNLGTLVHFEGRHIYCIGGVYSMQVRKPPQTELSD